jgi:hypothetical protein
VLEMVQSGREIGDRLLQRSKSVARFTLSKLE